MPEPDVGSLDLSRPESVTRAASSYFEAGFATLGVLEFLFDTILLTDWSAHVIDSILGDTEIERSPGTPAVDASPLELAAKQPGTRTRFLKQNSQMLLQMFFARLVDNFQVYVVEIIRASLVKQPKILTSSEPQLSLEYAFQFNTLDEMIADLIERKVSDLSYQGLMRLGEWCGARGIPLIIREADVAALTEAMEARNVIAHHRGLVDARYIRNVPSTAFALNSLRKLSVRQVFDTFVLLNRVVRETDKAVVEKFALDVVSIVPVAVADEGGPGSLKE